jgi:hypothetical protein
LLQGFVDIALLCSFTRMASILGFIQQRTASEIEEDLVQEVTAHFSFRLGFVTIQGLT